VLKSIATQVAPLVVCAMQDISKIIREILLHRFTTARRTPVKSHLLFLS
jgi:hypothetical protein